MQTIQRLALGLAIFLGVFLDAWALEPQPGVTNTLLLNALNSWNDQPLVYPKGQAEVTGVLIEIAPGAETGWHRHPIPSFAMVLEGTLEVSLRNGRVKRVQAGEAFAEVVNTLHNGRNVGDKPAKLVVFYAGVLGEDTTVPQP
ncbi:MAG: cupin domain-containing protein [Pseudomonadota bacterium]